MHTLLAAAVGFTISSAYSLEEWTGKAAWTRLDFEQPATDHIALVQRYAQELQQQLDEGHSLSTSSLRAGAAVPSTEQKPVFSNDSPEAVKVLRVNRPWVINLVILCVLASIAVVTVFGYGHGTKSSLFGMVLASYVILIPGLVSKDFSFNIAINVDLTAVGLPPSLRPAVEALIPDLPKRMQITQPRGFYGPIHESTRSFVGLLWQSDCEKGAVLVAMFAFGMPLLKLLLLCFGGFWWNSAHKRCATAARWSILFVQIVSKWAAPDTFAIILLYYLLRNMHHPPLLESIQMLDLGFTFYCTFSVFSVISCLSIRIPEPESSLDGAQEREPLILRILGRSSLACIIYCIAIAWFVFFAWGLGIPCLSMRLDQDRIMQQLNIPNAAMGIVTPIVNKIGLKDMIEDDVSVWKCTWTLCGWFFHGGSLNLLLASVALAGLVILVTCLDMVMLVVAASQLVWGGGQGLKRSMDFVHVLKHLSFMDVLVVGVIVIVYAGAIYAEQGIVVNLQKGIWILLTSEVLHWTAYLAMESASSGQKFPLASK